MIHDELLPPQGDGLDLKASTHHVVRVGLPAQ